MTMITKHSDNMKKIGTRVLSCDGFSTRLGQVADHESDKWGVRHVVLICGKFEEVSFIGGEDMKGIGWKVATAAEIERHERYAAAE
jgi:hypothetical protein